MLILAIETSCDETSLALVEAEGDLRNPQFKIQKLLTASQIETHRPWGGVVPNLAKREHQKNLPLLLKKLEAKSHKLKADAIAITVGPGLEPCLWQGIEFAKKLAKSYKLKAKSLVGVNHLHGHMYSFLLQSQCHPERSEGSQDSSSAHRRTQKDIFPAIQLLVSGGHTILLLMESLTKYKKLGETRDDAAGEAFDKVARMLGLPYPGGPEIERLAKKSQMSNVKGQRSIIFPRPMLHDKNYDFSFSGLKTSVLYYLKANEAKSYKPSSRAQAEGLKANVAAAFQEAVIDVLVTKTIRAAKEYGAKSVILSGGVAANQALQKLMKLKAISYKLNFLSADKKFQGDNAAMIAIASYITFLHKKKYLLKANGSLDI